MISELERLQGNVTVLSMHSQHTDRSALTVEPVCIHICRLRFKKKKAGCDRTSTHHLGTNLLRADTKNLIIMAPLECIAQHLLRLHRS